LDDCVVDGIVARSAQRSSLTLGRTRQVQRQEIAVGSTIGEAKLRDDEREQSLRGRLQAERHHLTGGDDAPLVGVPALLRQPPLALSHVEQERLQRRSQVCLIHHVYQASGFTSRNQ
jgi:hypothetical protein